MKPSAGAGIHYDFGGLRLRSAFVLPGLAIVENPGERATDIRISLGAAPLPTGQPICQWRGRYRLDLEARGDDWLIRHGDELGITISNSGQELRCHCPDPASVPLLAEIITRRILARICVLRGRLPIHAATLGDGEGATMLLGSSGSGKSTMTAALTQRLGWEIFGDDMSVLDDDGHPVVFPTVPGVSVRQESLGALDLPAEAGRPWLTSDGKAWYATARTASPPPQPLEAVILLSLSPADGGIEHRRLSGPSVLVQLSSQMVPFNPRDGNQLGALMDRFKRMITKVPVHGLAYPRDYDALPEVVDTIQRLRSATPRATV